MTPDDADVPGRLRARKFFLLTVARAGKSAGWRAGSRADGGRGVMGVVTAVAIARVLPGLAALSVLWSGPVPAQTSTATMTGLRADRTRAAVMEHVQFLLDFPAGTDVACSVEVDFGDGSKPRKVRAEDVPTIFYKNFSRPGSYTVQVKGEQMTRFLRSLNPCQGVPVSFAVTVVDPEGERSRREARDHAEAVRQGQSAAELRQQLDQRERQLAQAGRSLDAREEELNRRTQALDDRERRLRDREKRVAQAVPAVPARIPAPASASAPAPVVKPDRGLDVFGTRRD